MRRRTIAWGRWAAAVLALQALVAPGDEVAREQLVPLFAACRYWIPTNDALGTSWTADQGFNDAAWTAGTSAIGYQSPAGALTNWLNSTVPSGTTAVYARWPFSLTNALTANVLTLRVQFDDGFIAYLNGQQVAAVNAPAAPLYNSLATTQRLDDTVAEFQEFDLTSRLDLLHAGTNVLAVRVLNGSNRPGSGDLLLQPNLIAITYTPAGGSGLVINEIHSAPDLNAELVKFVELYNTGTQTVELSGWQFTSGIDFTFPAGTFIGPHGYAVAAENPVACSNKFQRAALGPFLGSLKSGGDNLVLRNGLGEKVDEVNYGLGFPWPTVGDAPGRSLQLINPALDNNLGGAWRSALPSPASSNAVWTTLPQVPPMIRQVEHTPKQPTAGQVVTIRAKVTDADGVGAVTLQVQTVNPGSYIRHFDAAYTNNWTNYAMHDDGANGDTLAGDSLYTVQVPAVVQTHRRLVRYRITALDTPGNSLRGPYADDPQPNFAYFVYNGLPAWTAAAQPGVTAPVAFDAGVMGSVPAYHLLATRDDVEHATWIDKYTGDAYLWTGAMVYDGVVYDHIGFRARGGIWRYSMGKNMWKFSFNRGHYLEAHDDYGRAYGEARDNLNLSACIQQGDFNHRGEQGMFEAVGFRLFNLTGTPSSKTHWLTLRIVDDAAETGPTQYDSDFWGLYLAIEQLDGQWLDEHHLPDGNTYKWEGGPDQSHQGRYSVADKSDVNSLNAVMETTPSNNWWRLNVNLEAYYGYRTILDTIHHYDLGTKNYYYYFDPTPITNAYGVAPHAMLLPWDLDLTWADNMFAHGDEPFRENGALTHPGIALDYRNRVRELRDLLINTDEGWRLINEYAGLIWNSNGPSIVDADRAQWDYNPVMINSAYCNVGKAGHGRFYAVAPTRDFPGMAKKMRDYLAARATSILDPVAADSAIPLTPLATAAAGTFPVNNLSFLCSSFRDPQGSNTFAAMEWRLGEITDPAAPAYNPSAPGYYEIEAVWTSGLLTNFTPTVTLPNDVARVGHRYRLRVRMQDDTGRWSRWSDPVAFTAIEPDQAAAMVASLRITELMVDPPAGSAYEFIELRNTSTNMVLEVGGATFTAGITYTLPAGTVIAPQGYLLLVQAAATDNFRAFRNHYGLADAVPIVGPYSGSLNHGGEQRTLKTATAGSAISAFAYRNSRGWPLAAAGAGHSLVPLALANQAGGALDYGGNWRASTYLGGSPGRTDPSPPRALLLNEIIAHTDYTNALRPEYDSNDAIELFNSSGQGLTLTNWFLSDDAGDLRKWAIPSGATVAAGGRILFSEVEHFHNPITSGFGINKAGEVLYLSHLPGTTNDRVVDCVAFKGQENEVAWGRHPDGDDWWRALAPPTANAANAGAIAAPVIDELMYHPAPAPGATTDNTTVEYVELYNPTATAIPLWNAEVGPWRIDGGIAFALPTNQVLAAGERLVLVPFDPATNAAALQVFVDTYALTNGPIRLLGPYSGKLANSAERVALERGVAPDAPGDSVSWAVVDEVLYADQSPWPSGADGGGPPLQRLYVARPGNDPANWSATYLPTPGGAATPSTNIPPYVSWAIDQFGAEGLPGGAPTDDWDNDGFDNWGEYVAGTDPADIDSHPALHIQTIGLAAVVDWLALAAVGEGYDARTRHYRLEANSNIIADTWLPVTDFSDITGANQTVHATNTTSDLLYYRLHIWLE